MSPLTVMEKKAIRLAAHGHVEEVPPTARVFTVRSENDPHHFYIVGLDKDGTAQCDCPAGRKHRRCSHAISVELTVEHEASQAVAA